MNPTERLVALADMLERTLAEVRGEAGAEVTPAMSGAIIPPHVLPGELIESAWGNAVVDALQIHENPVPSGRIYQTTLVTLAPLVDTVITMGATDFLRGGCTKDSDSLVAPVAGIHLVTIQLGTINGIGNAGITGGVNIMAWVQPAAGGARLVIRDVREIADNWAASTASLIVSLAAGDKVHMTALVEVDAFADPAAGWMMPSSVSLHFISP